MRFIHLLYIVLSTLKSALISLSIDIIYIYIYIILSTLNRCCIIHHNNMWSHDGIDLLDYIPTHVVNSIH